MRPRPARLSRRRRAFGSAGALLAAAVLAVPAAAQAMADETLTAPSSVGVAAPDGPPNEARYVNRAVPDIVVRTASGPTKLSALWRQGPLVLSMVFTRCAGICSPYLHSLARADRALGLPDDLHRVVVSFDPRDTPERMQRTGERLGVAGRPGWTLGTASPEDVDKLARALGFWFEWDEARQQFDHPALLVGIRDGRVARLLVGGSITAARLDEVVREARGQFIAGYPLPGDVLFRCFDYDPGSGAPRLAWGAIVLLAPALGAAATTLALFRSTRPLRGASPRSAAP